MFRTLRNFRQSLMNQESAAGRYAIYAVGEILLVMVGILLALQVNNWNEDRKERNLEKTILGQLEASISQDMLRLKTQEIRFQNMLEETEWVIRQFESDAHYVPRMDSALAIISTFSIAEADYTPFNYLENVGIGIVKDEELRNMISNYYAYSRFIAEVDDYFELNKYFRQVIYPKYFKRYRYGSFVIPNDYQELKSSNEFRVVVDMCYNDSVYYLRMTSRQMVRAQEILDRINAKLLG